MVRLSLLCLLLTGCAHIPDYYPVPSQSTLFPATASIGSFVNMSDANADAYIVGDVNDGLEAGSSRWTRRRPTLRFYVDSADNLRFQADFSIAESTLRDTGPVAVSVFINGNLLDTVHCPAAAAGHFDKRVPSGFLHAQSMNFAMLEIDKLWSPPSHSVELGFLLAGAGFSR